MRRLIASIVFCLLTWGSLPPLTVAATGDPIPPCCRRDGKHHCMMAGMAARKDGSPRVSTKREPCPYSSLRGTPAGTGHPPIALAMARFLLRFTCPAEPEAVVRESRCPSSKPQRGPPTNSALNS